MKHEWVSVEDRLPAHKQWVLVWRDDYSPSLQSARYYAQHSQGAGFYCGGQLPGVGFWTDAAALPEPKEDR